MVCVEELWGYLVLKFLRPHCLYLLYVKCMLFLKFLEKLDMELLRWQRGSEWGRFRHSLRYRLKREPFRRYHVLPLTRTSV